MRRLLVSLEFKDLVGADEPGTGRYIVVEMVRNGGPRDGRTMGLAVIDSVPDNVDEDVSMEVFATQGEAEARVRQLEATS